MRQAVRIARGCGEYATMALGGSLVNQLPIPRATLALRPPGAVFRARFDMFPVRFSAKHF
jgi:hypothetical protein